MFGVLGRPGLLGRETGLPGMVKEEGLPADLGLASVESAALYFLGTGMLTGVVAREPRDDGGRPGVEGVVRGSLDELEVELTDMTRF